VPHTTALRGNRWEVRIAKPFLKDGAFHVQQIQSVPYVRLLRKLGKLTDAELAKIHERIRERFQL
jgi:mRNA interferase MazF